jgi:phage terminase large subunit-like protein
LDRRGIRYVYNRSLGVITIGTGQRIHLRGGDDIDLGRGLNLSGAWLDESGTWRRAMTAWSEGIVPAVRQKLPNGRPHVVITSTPKPGQGAELLKMLLARDDGSVVVTRGSTFSNSGNLSEEAVAEMKARYPEGSRLYRQELLGEIVEDIEGALFAQSIIDSSRVLEAPDDLNRVVVAVDPAVTYGPDSDDTGILVVGSRGGADRQFYVIADLTMKAPPAEWGKAAILAAEQFGADAIAFEVNQGGSLVTQVIRQAGLDLQSRGTIAAIPRLVPVRATRGKAVRAEPVSALYEMGRVHHVGAFPLLEEQMCGWVPGVTRKSPDRVDALVWGVTSLMGANARRAGAF